MISGMDALEDRMPAAPGADSTSHATSGPLRLPAILGGVAGCLILVLATSPLSGYGDEFAHPFLTAPGFVSGSGRWNLLDWLTLLAPIAATALGLVTPRWWPYVLAAAALLVVPSVLIDFQLDVLPDVAPGLATFSFYLAIVAVASCAQGLVRTAAGWGAAVAALTVGSRLLGPALSSAFVWVYYGPPQDVPINGLAVWHAVLLGLALTGLSPALWGYRRGDASVAETVGPWSLPRARLVVTGTLAACMAIPQAFLTTPRLADLLGVTWDALARHSSAQAAAIGALTLVTTAVLAACAGLWPLAGAVTAAAVQVGAVVPVDLALATIGVHGAVKWLALAAGMALGAVVAAGRWRFPLAATLTVFAATAMFIAFAATTGDPEKLADQRVEIPGVLILVLCVGAACAVVGATAPVLAPRGALPVVLGPLAVTLAANWEGIEQTTTRSMADSADSIGLDTVLQWNVAAVVLLVSGAAIGGLGFAQLLATRRAERKHAEQIRLEAAAAERDRLARPIHDGVLQVLALVQRHGSELGNQGSELAALAGEQEVALRSLLAGGTSDVRGGAQDLRGPLRALATLAVEVVTPVHPVALSSDTAAEVIAAVRAALDNVRRHAGEGARTWILLEDEGDGVRVTVRDDGVGFPPQRPAEAAEAGRLGIAQSMRGRIADLGGSTAIESRPGEGTEVEFWIPRERPARREAGTA
jgi:signal transduction histidine kinase